MLHDSTPLTLLPVRERVTSCSARSLPVRILLLLLVLPLSLGTSARRTTGDSLRAEKLRPLHLIAPAALIAVGSVGVTNGWFCSVKEDVRKGFHDFRGDRRFRADDYLQYVPVAAHLGLGFIGVKARHPFRERLAAAATASIFMAATVNTVKYSVCESRPDNGRRNSFPSGHTATAFMGAELIRIEYGNGYGAGAYVFASCIAALRVYNDRHWLNDVIGGAGFGILSARVGYWLLPLERRLFRWDRPGPAVTVLPAYSTAGQAFSLSLAATF